MSALFDTDWKGAQPLIDALRKVKSRTTFDCSGYGIEARITNIEEMLFDLSHAFLAAADQKELR